MTLLIECVLLDLDLDYTDFTMYAFIVQVILSPLNVWPLFEYLPLFENVQ